MRTHRSRAAARGLVRVEVQAPKGDAGLIRALAEALRGGTETAEALRSVRAKALHPEVETAFDIFGSALPDEAFAGVFDQPRQRNRREVDLKFLLDTILDLFSHKGIPKRGWQKSVHSGGPSARR